MNKKIMILILFLKSMISIAQVYNYGIPSKPWDDDLGNHRAEVIIKNSHDAVRSNIYWRRRDENPEKKRIIILDANGNEVKNIYRININREFGEFVFQPVSGAGKYYVYYMPYIGKKNIGYWSGKYLAPEEAANKDWIDKNHLQNTNEVSKLENAEVLKIESRTAFDSFYPMEVCAASSEVNQLIEKSKDNFLLFPEDRKFPIRMTTDLPYKWIQSKPSSIFKGTASRNEYYAFQVGVFAAKTDLNDVQVSCNNKSVTCFNTEGVDADGKPFVKNLSIGKGKVQALWFGIDIGKSWKPGKYTFRIGIKPKNQKEQFVDVEINVNDKILEDRGDSEPWRHSRLRWLNSTLGLDDKITKPYTPLEVKDKTINCLMRKVTLNTIGLPEIITAKEESVLNSDIQFVVETEDKMQVIKPTSFRFVEKKEGKVTWKATGENELFALNVDGEMEFDGTLDYKIKVVSKKNIQVKDIRLVIPVNKKTAQYFMGMGLAGGNCPESYKWKWKGPNDSFWIGSVNAGLHCELRGTTYSGPLLNLYHPAPPASWYNQDNGGFTIESVNADRLDATVYTGNRILQAGSEIVFPFRFLITPVKEINTKDQFVSRYYHDGNKPAPSVADLSSGIKITNVHHGNPINPYINYPFVAVDSMKNFVNKWHSQGLKVKIYYTIRELTNQVPEIWALRSLGDEVLANGKGGGYPWLQEHLISNYDVQWFMPINGYSECDAAILTSGKSRWYNYYLEGLKWLVKNEDIDGLYLDDVAFDRDMIKRIRKTMDDVKPGCLIDLHSNTGFSRGPANQYTEYFPFIDKLWFGESFIYDKMPADNWIVESSGIPFGLMGDMLHAGGNPWRGMIYGMTVRYPWGTEGVTCDPRDIWKVWDSFKIENSVMIGYWDKKPVVKTSNPNVLATAYLNNGKMLISIASWEKEPVDVTLDIDWKNTGISPNKVKFFAPEIKNFQEQKMFALGEKIRVQPTKGWLLLVE